MSYVFKNVHESLLSLSLSPAQWMKLLPTKPPPDGKSFNAVTYKPETPADPHWYFNKRHTLWAGPGHEACCRNSDTKEFIKLIPWSGLELVLKLGTITHTSCPHKISSTINLVFASKNKPVAIIPTVSQFVAEQPDESDEEVDNSLNQVLDDVFLELGVIHDAQVFPHCKNVPSNQSSGWDQTKEVMGTKQKRKWETKHVDPYSGKQASGKKALPDAQQPKQRQIELSIEAPSSSLLPASSIPAPAFPAPTHFPIIDPALSDFPASTYVPVIDPVFLALSEPIPTPVPPLSSQLTEKPKAMQPLKPRNHAKKSVPQPREFVFPLSQYDTFFASK
ncbi:hypothetical protein C8J56DRAFT_1057643 [Mycena floridula]|nr:hypothetical protein C8J56DRAFT_1057643 [Mycena floridula]